MAATHTKLICPLTCGTVDQMRAEMANAKQAGADCVECRLDFIEHEPTPAQLSRLLDHAPVETLVTARPTSQGGRFAGDESRRLELLHAAAAHEPAVMDIEFTVPPENWPKANVVSSFHDFTGRPADLGAVVAQLSATPAAVEKIAFMAKGPEDALAALDILRNATRPCISLAMGEHGISSRILAKKFGAFGTFASLRKGRESAPGQPTLDELKTLYRWDHLDSETEVYGVVGCPIAHSMSPAIHNAAFEASGMNAVYVPFKTEPGADNFRRFMDAALARPWLDLRGLSVTLPHKENALAYVGQQNCDELSARIGAINTIIIDAHGNLRAENTDYAAAIDALCQSLLIRRQDLKGRHVAVLGAGGVARAIVAALVFYGAQVTVYNRTLGRAQALAGEFECKAADLAAGRHMDAEIVINCTPIGMYPHVDETPLPHLSPSVKIVFDTIYNPIETQLLHQAQAEGLQTVSGVEMFVNQATAQFELWTGRTAPRETMRHVVIQRLTHKR